MFPYTPSCSACVLLSRLGMCEACRGYRNVHCYLILDGVEYDSKSLWNGDFESWFHATRLPWLGKLAFPLSPDPSLAIRTRKAKTHALQHESSDDESEGFSSEETVLDKNSLLLLKSQDTKSSLYLPLGSHCFQQAKKWHEIQHYKYFLLKSIHKYLKKFNDKILEDPIEAAECLKKKYGQLLYNRFECTVIEAKPNAIKKGTRKDPVATDPWNL
ncbi:hypothetical protein IE077_003803 [Cardiosporidium cionae]|uniref:Uncharacterized protein n=1 Tax=Cardiosporidium cionae TaxID=476202 RepID=A0ABQ7JEW1_9APIC|nr:hypothetical protein IE077_003803 [Cardiosporidium cionae]|eukprot:KAF8822419.1 hypothetical protein IE077_003803 [Cardiosporidium cionae]